MVPKEIADLHGFLTSKVARITKLAGRVEASLSKYKGQLQAVETTMQLQLGKMLTEARPVQAPKFYGGGEAVPLRPTNTEIEQAYEKAQPAFTIKDVIYNLGPRFADSDIARSMASNFLRRLEDDGKVRVAERGTGRRPSTYIKESSNTVRAVGPTISMYPSGGASEPKMPVPATDDSSSQYDDAP